MFDRMATLGSRAPRAVVTAAVLVLLVAGGLALLLRTAMPAGGYTDPDSESAQAERVLQERFGTSGMSLVLLVTAEAGIDSPQARDRAAQLGRDVTASGHTGPALSYWDLPPGPQRDALRGKDGRSGLLVTTVAGDDGVAPERAGEIAERVSGNRDGVEVRAGGQAMVYQQLTEQSFTDLARVELFAIPITMLVLVWVFGSAVAALIPLGVSLFSTVCTIALLRVLAAVTDISIFALSVASPLCLALAIDYTLFIVSRYREEVGGGANREDALRTTLSTTGRTVLYSALTVAVSLAMMILFPVYFLRSVGFAGLISVLLSAVGALVVAPAVLKVLGPRIDAWDMRKPILRMLGARPPALVDDPKDSFWYRSTRVVMRFAIPAALAMVAGFALLATPFLDVRFGYPDDRVLPPSVSARQVGDELRSGFSGNAAGEVQVVLPDGASASADRLADYASKLSAAPGVTAVSGPGGTYVDGTAVGPPQPGREPTAGPAARYTVTADVDPISERAVQQLAELKAVPAPSRALFTGVAQQNDDNVAAITSRVPLVLGLIAAVSFVLLFLFTGSLVLPLKALVMNALSLTAAFGAMVWVFQEGHLGGLGTTATGALVVSIPPMVFCVAFGLSMDYEVFMLSRIREEWLRTGDNGESVAVGLARTGRIVSTAAILMVIVFGALATAEVSFVRMLGAGLTLTILLDAFLIRLVLVPAFMRLAGRANWWAPAPLRRWHSRHGLTD
jgi:putative drug exporter of the RND superfamily